MSDSPPSVGTQIKEEEEIAKDEQVAEVVEDRERELRLMGVSDPMISCFQV